jgi:hypothetical protein
MDEATLNTLKQGADRAAIENLLGLYCRAIDRLDVELLKSVYHTDGVDDHGAICANAHEFAAQIVAMLKDLCVYTMHSVSHSTIEIRGDRARAESYYIAIHTVAAGAEPIRKFFGENYLEEQRAAGRLGLRHEYLCSGRYLDELSRRDGAWRIQRRKMTNEWATSRPEAAVREGVPGAFAIHGSRDRDDPVYRLALS